MPRAAHRPLRRGARDAGRLATQGAADHMIFGARRSNIKAGYGRPGRHLHSSSAWQGRGEACLEAGIDQVVAPLGRLVSIDRREWTGERLDFGMSAAGQTARGLVNVEDTRVRIELELPRVLAAIAKRVRGVIQQRGRGLLEKK